MAMKTKSTSNPASTPANSASGSTSTPTAATPRALAETVLDPKPVYTVFPDNTYTLTVGGKTSAQEDVGLAVIAGQYVGCLLESENGDELLAGPVVNIKTGEQATATEIEEVEDEADDDNDEDADDDADDEDAGGDNDTEDAGN